MIGRKPDTSGQLSGFGSFKQFRRNNGEFWNIYAVPIALCVDTRYPPSGIRILNHSHAVPDQSAAIDFIVKDASLALWISVQGRGIPLTSTRRADAVSI